MTQAQAHWRRLASTSEPSMTEVSIVHTSHQHPCLLEGVEGEDVGVVHVALVDLVRKKNNRVLVAECDHLHYASSAKR